MRAWGQENTWEGQAGQAVEFSTEQHSTAVC